MKIGSEVLQTNPGLSNDWGQCVLLSNYASLDSKFNPTWAVVKELLGDRLVAMLGPQHGFYGTVQDNMIETPHEIHRESGLKLFSLYSEIREPTDEMLANVDTILIDLQISGCRVYTFKYTIAACLRAAKRNGLKVVVLDRLNPLGGELVEGSTLNPDCTSFVGEFRIPMRHGLTPGEAAQFFNCEINADLEVIRLDGWQPKAGFDQWRHSWILTSPNLPSMDAVRVYPGTVLFEGTNVSEGRGTALPFQLIGHPSIAKPQELVNRVWQLLKPLGGLEGVGLRPAFFEPTSQKWAQKTCGGCHIYLESASQTIWAYDLGIALVRAFFELIGSDFAWKQPPYEYDYETLPIKLICGFNEADSKLTSSDFNILDPQWHKGASEYMSAVEPYLIYDRKMRSPQWASE